MPWKSANLSSILGPVTNAVSDAIGSVNGELNKFRKLQSDFQNKMNQLSSALGETADTIRALNESGLYTIALKPKAGSWATRLRMAPTQDGGVLPSLGWSTGMCTIILAPDPANMIDSFQSLLDCFDGAPKKPEDPTSIADYINPIGDELASLMDKAKDRLSKKLHTELDADIWYSLTIGDFLGGFAKATADAVDALSNKARQAAMASAMADAKIAALENALDEANRFAQKMNATGAYSITLTPGIGDFVTRLTMEAGAPPSGQEWYTCGLAACAVGPDMTSLGSKWSCLSKFA